MSREFDAVRCAMLKVWVHEARALCEADAQAEIAGTLGAMRQILRVRGDLRLAVLEVLGQDACGPPEAATPDGPG